MYFSLLSIWPSNCISTAAEYQPGRMKAVTNAKSTDRARRNPFAFFNFDRKFIRCNDKIFQTPNTRTLFKDGRKFDHDKLTELTKIKPA